MSEKGEPPTPSQAQEASAVVTDDKIWYEGTLHLITSDRVRFQIPPYYLFANSVVFRDMSDTGTMTLTPVHLSDPHIESASALRDVLKLLSDWELPTDLHGPLNTANGELVMRLVWIHHFLTKYDCPGPLKVLKSLISAKRRDGQLSGMCDFLLCANIDDVEGCDRCVINEGQVGYELFRNIPGHYFWALMQSCAALKKETRFGESFRGSVSIAKQADQCKSGGV